VIKQDERGRVCEMYVLPRMVFSSKNSVVWELGFMLMFNNITINHPLSLDIPVEPDTCKFIKLHCLKFSTLHRMNHSLSSYRNYDEDSQ
jgi:hypothetical protein